MDAPLPAFSVGSVPVYGDLILSPMEGFSDLPFRSICRAMGSAMSYTEFINAMDILQGSPEVQQKIAFLAEERPVVFQIFDNDPQRLLQAALLLRTYQPDILDINMGCSVRRVSGRGAGAGLLRTPLKVARIFRTLTRELDIPLTAKIRLGWDTDTLNYALIARIVEENGGALVAVHGRSRSQGYGGEADWDAIAHVKQMLKIPVIANGDVKTVQDIHAIQALTGCDAVMIGRAAMGNPWIFARQERSAVSPAMVCGMVQNHLQRMLAFYGESDGLIKFRKHASRYLNFLSISPQQRNELLTAEEPQSFIQMLQAVCP